MNVKTPFCFKVLRYIHDSFTGEFLNIGLVLYSKTNRYLQIRLSQKYARITNTFPSADGEYFHQYITSLQTKFDEVVETVNNKQLSFELWRPENIDELLERVLPTDDSAIQFGPLQSGVSSELDVIFNDLYYRLVEAYIPSAEHLSRTEQEIWNLFSKPLRSQNVINLLRPAIIRASHDNIDLEHAWKNGRWKALQPISFDLQHSGNIQKKARTWLGTSVILSESLEIDAIYYLLGKPRRDDPTLQRAYSKAKDLLGTGQFSEKIEVIEEDAAEDFASHIAPQIRADSDHSG